jgi:hypothetical protein
MGLQIDKVIADQLGDIKSQVVLFQEQLEAHAFTVNIPAPTSLPIIEEIVRIHAGEFVIVEPEIDSGSAI